MGIRTEVKIDFSQLNIPWQPGFTYRVDIEGGFVREDGGELLESPAVPNAITFSTQTTGPVTATSVPSDGATGVLISEFTITFNRNITRGTSGTVKLYKAPNTLIQSFNITDTEKIEILPNSPNMRIIATGLIDSKLTEYYLLLDAGIVKDFDTLPNVAITDPNALRWATGLGAQVVSTTPAINSINNLNNSTFTFVFDRPVDPLVGSFNLYRSGGTLVNSYDVFSGLITYNDETVTIDLDDKVVLGGTDYYWLWNEGILKDSLPLTNEAVTNASTITWRTALGPVIGTTSPTNGASNVQNTSTITLTFNRTVTPFTQGSILIKDTATGTTLATIASNNSRVTINGLIITVDVSGYIKSRKGYTIDVQQGAFIDANGLYSERKEFAFTSDFIYETLYSISVNQDSGNRIESAFDISSTYLVNAVPGASGYRGALEVRSATTGSVLRTINHPSGGSSDFATISVEGTSAAVASGSNIYIYNLGTGALTRTINVGSDLGGFPGIKLTSSYVILGDNNYPPAPANPSYYGRVLIYNRSTGALHKTIDSPIQTQGYLFGDKIAVDGDWLAVSGLLNSNAKIYLYQIGSGVTTPFKTALVPYTSRLSSMKIASDTLYVGLPAADVEGRVMKFDIVTALDNTNLVSYRNASNTSISSKFGECITANSDIILIGQAGNETQTNGQQGVEWRYETSRVYVVRASNNSIAYQLQTPVNTYQYGSAMANAGIYYAIASGPEVPIPTQSGDYIVTTANRGVTYITMLREVI